MGKNGVEVIVCNGKWLNEINIKDPLKHSNLAAVALQYSSEIDKQGHNDRVIDYETERQKVIEKELGCEFIVINPA